MKFHTLPLFVIGVLVPFAVVLVHLLDRRRQQALMERLGELPAVQRMMATRSPRRRAIKAVLIGLGLGGVLMAASRPWKSTKSVTHSKGMDLVVALDVSKSMLVGDVQIGQPHGGFPSDLKDEDPRPAPDNAEWVQGTRLERARQVLDATFDKLPDDRLGVVMFAGASIHFPLTDDEHLATLLAHLVGPTDLMGGSDIGEAIRVGKCLLRGDLDDPGVGCYGIGERGTGGATDVDQWSDRPRPPKRVEESERGKAILVITDGGTSNPQVAQEVDQARQLGISLFFLGVGSDQGGVVPELDYDGKVTGPKKDASGNVVHSKLDREGLRQLAAMAGDDSHYLEIAPNGPFDITPIINALGNVPRGDAEESEEDRPHELYHWILFPGLMLLVIEAAVGMRKRVKHPEAVP